MVCTTCTFEAKKLFNLECRIYSAKRAKFVIPHNNNKIIKRSFFILFQRDFNSQHGQFDRPNWEKPFNQTAFNRNHVYRHLRQKLTATAPPTCLYKLSATIYLSKPLYSITCGAERLSIFLTEKIKCMRKIVNKIIVSQSAKWQLR